jgi:hypothetical protein
MIPTIAVKTTFQIIISTAQHLHRFRAWRKRLLGSFAASGNCFICPSDRAQYDALRFASAADGVLVVTAVFNLLPGLALRYADTPFLVMPAPCLVGRKLPDFTEVLMPMPFLVAITQVLHLRKAASRS